MFGLAMPILEFVFQVPAPELQIQFLFYYTQLSCPKMQATLLYEISFFILQGYGIKVILQSSYLVKLPDCIQCYYNIFTHKLTFQKRVTLTSMIQMESKLLFGGCLINDSSLLVSRTQINFTVAIDFTASNGEYHNDHLIKMVCN